MIILLCGDCQNLFKSTKELFMDNQDNSILYKRIKVSIMDNKFMPEINSYGPIYNAMFPIEKIVSLMDRGVIIRFNSKEDMLLVNDFIDKYTEIANRALEIDPTTRINLPERSKQQIELSLKRMHNRGGNNTIDKISIHGDIEQNIFEETGDTDIIEDLADRLESERYNAEQKNRKPIDREKQDDFEKRKQMYRQMTNINLSDLQPIVEDDLSDLEIR